MSHAKLFELDPVPPSARVELLETSRRKTREKVAAHTRRKKAAGNSVLSVYIPKTLIEQIDAERIGRKLRSRADTVVELFGELPQKPFTQRVLVSVASEHAGMLDELAAANGFKNRSAAIEMVIDTILANPALKQELGL